MCPICDQIIDQAVYQGDAACIKNNIIFKPMRSPLYYFARDTSLLCGLCCHHCTHSIHDQTIQKTRSQ